MPAYKLTHFSVEAKGELIRLIFAQTSTAYENVRITFEDWPSLKPSTPFGYLPVLEVDGKELVGSGPIARYLAEQLGLAGANDFENAGIAGIKDVQDEVVLKMAKAFFEKDNAAKERMEREIMKDHIPKYLGLMEKTIEKNGGDWLFGLKLTYVDLNLYLLVDFMRLFKEGNLLEGYPHVRKTRDAVSALPNIAKWLSERPERTFGPPVA